VTAAASLPRATVAETLGVLTDVVAPTLAKGALLRRPRVVAAAERMQFDRRAVRRMQRLRDRYGAGPLLLVPTTRCSRAAARDTPWPRTSRRWWPLVEAMFLAGHGNDVDGEGGAAVTAP
jgi:hypothetical protein